MTVTGKGRVPKGPDKLGHNNGPKEQPTQIEAEAATPPDLPEGIDWHPQTRLWWDNLRFTPLTDLLMDVDWQFLLDTAYIHHQFWTTGKTTFATELRLRVGKIGVTPEERRRLRVEATATPSEPESTENSATSQRRRKMRIAG